MNVWLQPSHALTATIRLWNTCTPLHCAVFIWICFILNMFSPALNHWMLCAQIVISQDTSHLGVGGCSRSSAASISIHSWSVCTSQSSNALYYLWNISCPLKEDSPAQLSHTRIDLAHYQSFLTRYCLSCMVWPRLSDSKIASAKSTSVKQAAAWKQETHMADSAQWHN